MQLVVWLFPWGCMDIGVPGLVLAMHGQRQIPLLQHSFGYCFGSWDCDPQIRDTQVREHCILSRTTPPEEQLQLECSIHGIDRYKAFWDMDIYCCILAVFTVVANCNMGHGDTDQVVFGD